MQPEFTQHPDFRRFLEVTAHAIMDDIARRPDASDIELARRWGIAAATVRIIRNASKPSLIMEPS